MRVRTLPKNRFKKQIPNRLCNKTVGDLLIFSVISYLFCRFCLGVHG